MASDNLDCISLRSEGVLLNEPSLVMKMKAAKLKRFERAITGRFPRNAITGCVDAVGNAHADVPVSSWEYNPDILDLIRQHQGGVIVDLGAGFRPTYYADVLNIELGNFASTDIRAFAESIPLADESVDFLFSLAVFEHVADPFKVAKEVERVLKPGARVIIDTAFMAGRHGYPHHYYNMTKEGLLNLFRKIDVAECGVAPWGHAAYSVYWVLKHFSEGLTGDDKGKFGDLTVNEILSFSDPYFLMNDRPFLKSISARSNEDIAFNLRLTGTKSSKPSGLWRKLLHQITG